MQSSKSKHHLITHDPSLEQTVTDFTSRSPKDKRLILTFGFLGLVLIILGVIWVLNGRSFDFSKDKTPDIAYTPINDAVIATVGAEQIFAEDISYEQAFYPEAQRSELTEGIKERLITESIILQAGAEAGIIQLSKDVFNSVDKDRETRRQLLTKVEETINAKAVHKKGAVVSIWFMNFAPGPIGYDAGKQLALEKITAVYDAVLSGKMSIKQAGESIRNDTSLAQVDSVYDNNAYFEFDTREGDAITFDETFNQQLLSLNPGETTQLFTGQDYEQDNYDQPKKDAVFMFGKVTDAQTEGTLPFDQWVLEQRNNYEIIEY